MGETGVNGRGLWGVGHLVNQRANSGVCKGSFIRDLEEQRTRRFKRVDATDAGLTQLFDSRQLVDLSSLRPSSLQRGHGGLRTSRAGPVRSKHTWKRTTRALFDASDVKDQRGEFGSSGGWRGQFGWVGEEEMRVSMQRWGGSA